MIRISAVLLSPFVYLIGRVQGNFTVMYMASLIILICNISFSFEKVRDRIAFLCFNGTFFLFLTARPLTCILRNIQWTNIGYSYDADLFAVTMIYVSLLTLYVSASLTTIDNSLDTIVREEQSIFIKNIQFVSFIFFIIGFVCSMMEGMERILFMQTHTYVDIYTGEYRTSMPAVVKGFIQIMKPCMCIFLATLPSKRKSCFVLAAYLFSTLPSLRVGMRSPTMLACVFIFCLLCLYGML
ncbi:MAG: O-antigen polysaccharide polymerase Wzy [Clostridia bacterium]